MTDQELADAIRERFLPGVDGPYSHAKFGGEIVGFLMANPEWEPKWGDKVRHGVNPEARWYVGLNPQRDAEVILVEGEGYTRTAKVTSLKPWEDEA